MKKVISYSILCLFSLVMVLIRPNNSLANVDNVIHVTPGKPYDDQLRVLDGSTRELIQNLNADYATTENPVQFYVFTLKESYYEGLDPIEEENEVYLAQLQQTLGKDHTYILLTYEVLDTEYKNSTRYGISTNHPENPIVKSLSDDFMNKLLKSRTNDVTYFPEKGIPDLIKLTAKQINQQNHYHFENLNLAVKPVNKLPADIENPEPMTVQNAVKYAKKSKQVKNKKSKQNKSVMKYAEWYSIIFIVLFTPLVVGVWLRNSGRKKGASKNEK